MKGDSVRVEDDGVEYEIVEDDRRRLKDGRIEVRGHWVARGTPSEHYRRRHERRRARRRS